MTNGNITKQSSHDDQDLLVQEARRLMPGGVSSPARAALATDSRPLVVRRSEGAWLQDMTGASFADFQMAFGPLLVGHAHPEVVSAVQQAASQGLHHGALHEDEVHLARRLVADHPALEWVRFVNSGTEAVMSALRVARAATGRRLVVKFEGGYHGHSDGLLAKAGSGVATLGVPDSAGVTSGTASDTVTLAFDDEQALEELFGKMGDEIAAVLVEGVPANHGLLPQREAWHARLRALSREHGALLVVDEVITGSRLAWGGATQLLGLDPDLVVLGKVIGGGVPVGAYGGRRDLMEQVAPLGPVYQAGTLSGSPLGMAAGLATLQAFKRETDGHRLLEDRTKGFGGALEELAQDRGLSFSVTGVGSLLWLRPEDGPAPRSSVQLPPEARERFRRLHEALRKNGVWLPPSPYEVCFLSTAHDEEVLGTALDRFAEALKEVKP